MVLAPPPQMSSYDDALVPPVEPTPRVPTGPIPPAWYEKPPRPKLAEVLDRAEEERAAHDDRVAQGQRMLRRINNDETMAGVFSRLAKKVVTGEVERIQL